MCKLTSKTCSICHIGAPSATESEITEFLAQIPDWKIINVDGINQLIRTYKFANFIKALTFTNLIGELAESENHHPEIITEWGKVTIKWWTHKIKGLHLNDFVLAAKSDQLFSD